MRRLGAQEFESFVGGAGGRLLRVATLLTGEDPGAAPRALRLLTAALATTYADWDRLRGEDPYDRARNEIAVRFARSLRLGRRGGPGVLGPLTGRERLVLVLRLCEGASDEQTAALLGLPVERVRDVCAQAVRTMRRAAAAGAGPAAGRAPGGRAGLRRSTRTRGRDSAVGTDAEQRPGRRSEQGSGPAEDSAGDAGTGAGHDMPGSGSRRPARSHSARTGSSGS
jgi:Sigma-70, region 4